MDASAIFIINTRNLNPNFSGCRNRIFDFDIPALDLTSFEWTYVLPYARINFPFILPSICLKDTGNPDGASTFGTRTMSPTGA